MPTRFILFLLLGIAGAIASITNTQPAFAIHETLQSGKKLAEKCLACHGEGGLSSKEGVPHLAGQHALYIEKVLRAYLVGEREDPSMNHVTSELTERDISLLAFYYSWLPPFAENSPDAKRVYSVPDPFSLARPHIEGCSGCHGEDGNAYLEGMPGLAGQSPEYLATALTLYRDGHRVEATMQFSAESLSDDEIDNLALYYSRLPAKKAATEASGDRFAGQAMSVACAICHGDQGENLGPEMPRLAGQDAVFLETAMGAYLEGLRSYDLMTEALAELNARERQDVAAFFAARNPATAPPETPLTAPQWAARCDRCHGPGGVSTNIRFPILAGQSESYLIKALKLYHSNERPNPIMNAMLFVLSGPQIQDIAAYYARRGAEDLPDSEN